MYFIKSQRLGFRTWSDEDLPLAIKLWGDKRVTHFISARRHFTADQVKERLITEIASMETHCVQYWPVLLLSEGQFVGACGLHPYKAEERIFEFGVHICTDQWSKGYASEAGLAVMEYAFGSLSAKALFAGHHPRNETSRHLLGKIGFRYTHDEFYPPTGLMHPSYLIDAEGFTQKRRG